jgi:hypothetical protein
MPLTSEELFGEKKALTSEEFFSSSNKPITSEELFGSSPSLVDQIPGLAPQVVPVDDRNILEKVKDEYLGAHEAGLTALTGMAGMATGPMNIARRKLEGSSMTAEEAMAEGMSAPTYVPRTETGQRNVDKVISPLMNEMMPLMGFSHGFAPQLPKNFKGAPEVAKALPKAEPFNIVDPAFRAKLDEVSPGEAKILQALTEKANPRINETNQMLLEMDQILQEHGGNAPQELFEKYDLGVAKLRGLIEAKVKLEANLIGKPLTPEEVTIKVAEVEGKLAEQRREVSAPPEALPEVRSPHEIAQEKIGEASNESPEQIKQRLSNVQDKLDDLDLKELTTKEGVPGEEGSSLREALKLEEQTYTKLLEERNAPPEMVGDIARTVRESTPRNPTRQVMKETFGTFSTFGEIATKVREGNLGTAQQRTLFEILAKNPWVEKSLVHFQDRVVPSTRTPGNTVSGRYLHDGNVIRMFDDLGQVASPMRVLLHEAVHASVYHLLRDSTSQWAKSLHTMYEKFNEQNAGKVNPSTGKPHYGFTNVQEFVAEAFTSPSFMKVLKGMESISAYTNKVDSLWNQFKDLIKAGLKVFDPTIRSALDDVLEHGYALMEESAKTPENVFHKMSEKFEAEKAPDSVSEVSMKTLNAISTGVKKTGIEMFNKNNIAAFFKDHPRVKMAHDYINKAEHLAEKYTNMIWYDDAAFAGKAKFMDFFNKVVGKYSLYMAIEKATNKEMYNVLEVLKKGFRTLEYKENLALNGQHLTPSEVNIYNKIAEAELKKWDITTNEQKNMGKKHITPRVLGYFPAARKGEFRVEVGYGDLLAHVEYFSTRVAAERFKEKFGNLRHLEVSDVLTKESVRPETNAKMIDIFVEAYTRNFPDQAAEVQTVGGALLSKMQRRGGKMGHTQDFRTGIEGYKGTEMFMTPEELGHSFKNGIRASINDFAANMKSLHIKTDVEPFITDGRFQTSDPIGHAAVSQMFDNALGRNKDFLKPVTDVMNHTVDKWARTISEDILGKAYTRDKGIGASSYEGLTTLFYMTKMLPKFAFSVLGQLLSIPQVARVASKDGHGIMAYKSFTLGLAKLATRNKELYEALRNESQMYNTFEPGIMKQFDLYRQDQSKSMEFIKDWVLMQAPAKAFDGFSRIASFSILYEHNRKLGQSKEMAATNARLGTGEAQNLYGTNNQPAFFQHTGVMGDMVRPLQSYAQNYLGNLISDIQRVKVKDWNTWGPLVNFTIANIAVGGVLSLPLIQDYEFLRRFINQRFGDKTLPSVMDLFARDGNFLDRVLPAGEEERNAVIYGALPGFLDADVSASVRSNANYMTVVAGVLLGEKKFLDLVPIAGNLVDVTSGAIGIGKSLYKDVPVGERKKNINDALPAGHIAYLANELQGNNTTMISGKNTNQMTSGTQAVADEARTPTDIASGLMGTKTITQKKRNLIQQEQTDHEMLRTKQLNRFAALAAETGKPEYINKMVELGASKQEIEAAVKTGVFKRIIPTRIGSMVNQQGKVPKGQKTRNVLNNFRFTPPEGE